MDIPQAPHPKSVAPNDELAADLIRHKLNDLYESEPDAKQEARESELIVPRSPHQEFMYNLSHSGKSLAEIQTQWHQYYVSLPDVQKHNVWQEFYQDNNRNTHPLLQNHSNHPAHRPAPEGHPPSAPVTTEVATDTANQTKSYAELKNRIVGRVSSRAKLSKKHHLQSLMFGLSAGAITIFIMMFGLFNERFVAPFITPNRAVSNTPIIADPNSTVATGGPKVIIPKINVEIPVIYDQPSIEEQAIQSSLENGVVHYATTANPGEKGNTVIFGHSSNNILNKGKYKFAFVMLKRLEIGDTFMLTKDGKRYSYKVYDRKIVKPNEVGVLGATDKPSTATLITCDPPGTSLNRLVVIGEQISPDPNGNVASTATKADAQPQIVPGNAPSLWSRLTSIFRRS